MNINFSSVVVRDTSTSMPFIDLVLLSNPTHDNLSE